MQYKCENNVIEQIDEYLSPLIWGGLARQLLVIDSYAKRDWIGFQNRQWSLQLMIGVERYNSIV